MVEKYNDTVYYYHKSTRLWVEYTDQNVANDKWVNSETRPEYDGVYDDLDNGKVILSKSEYESMKSKIKELEKLRDESKTLILEFPKIVSRTETCVSFAPKYRVLDDGELKNMINRDVMHFQEQNKHLIETVNKLNELNETLRSRKWYQFWK